MEESYTNIPSSHFVGSVPAVVNEDKKTTTQEVPGANLQIFPPNNQGYQTIGGPSPSDDGGQQPTNNWKGVFSISSYTQYFNVDTDVVLNRLISSLYPTTGDFVSKIDANPDLYGLVWISTTLVFVIASLGNCATYLMNRKGNPNLSWTFDVNYVNVAAGAIYGYALIVPLGYYFLLQYLGSSVSLVRFWCLWGYSLFIFILTSFLLLIPLEFLRWTVILIAGAASASFISLNLKNYIQTTDLTIVVISAFVLQMGLSIFIKMWFFP
ncbi:Integral membrane Yip1 family protein [Perilla frutescens var. hirtella]|uniref:Protein YIP n=1 Tax=Perilla frutescens var. hirtella TaxID=608512 RepID=A0AAD4P6H5_PERFH|nr:Integral membrane Yip1 family protein [Perilla frutescens var. frutescens]KAH6787204.1 Integral membrane Yip1 family protein [Perilla frutescens var. hirtella]KAH6827725.1 Integral membrane Yip1 family protein [Perilla frutescens var. hirtella]